MLGGRTLRSVAGEYGVWGKVPNASELHRPHWENEALYLTRLL